MVRLTVNQVIAALQELPEDVRDRAYLVAWNTGYDGDPLEITHVSVAGAEQEDGFVVLEGDYPELADDDEDDEDD